MPTQNYFGPLSEMIEDSLNMDNTPGYLEPMETVAAKNKRRKFSSGTDICRRSTVWLGSSVVRVLARYARGPGFESRSGHVLFPPL